MNVTRTPQPLPASSPKLRTRRYQADICGPKTPAGGRTVIATGRFTSYDNARAWADTEYPEAEVVILTFFAASDGWTPRASGARRDGEWFVA